MMNRPYCHDAYGNSKYFAETCTICTNLKHMKEISGLSYRRISADLGFPPTAMINYITYNVRPNRERLEKIAAYFGIEDIEDLCMDKDEFKSKYPKMEERASE